MKYLVFCVDNLIKHVQSGAAFTTHDQLEKRILDHSVVLIVTKGDYYVKCLDEYTLKQGDVLFLPQGIEHGPFFFG